MTEHAAAGADRAQVLRAVRQKARDLVLSAPAARELDRDRRNALGRSLVDVSMLAADLLAEDRRLSRELGAEARAPLARAQEVIGADIGTQTARSLGQSVRAAKESIDFPTYVTSLISGVFQAIITSTTQQLTSMGELLDAVSATSDEFNAQISDEQVRQWVTGKLPYLRVVDGALSVPEDLDLYERSRELESALGATPEEVAGIDPGDLDATLLPLARRKMGRDKQGILATLVTMGLQRIVVDEGRLSASMDLRVDTRAATQREMYDQNDFRVNARVGASGSVGLWSANADVSTSVGQVHSDHQQTSQQVAAAAGLRSSVELAFRTEQVPLDRMADQRARVRIGQNARVPVDVTQGTLLAGNQAFTPFTTTTVPVATAPELPPRPALPIPAGLPGGPSAAGAGNAAGATGAGNPMAGGGAARTPVTAPVTAPATTPAPAVTAPATTVAPAVTAPPTTPAPVAAAPVVPANAPPPAPVAPSTQANPPRPGTPTAPGGSPTAPRQP